MTKSKRGKEPKPLIENRPLTKSEELLTHIGKLVSCDICHQQVIMGTNWLMTAQTDNQGHFIGKKAVCPACKKAVAATGALLVSI